MFSGGFAESERFKGSIADWSFKLGSKGQGYYQGAPQEAKDRKQGVEDDVRQPPREGSDDATARTSRKRSNDGTRVRARSRRKTANETAPTPTIAEETSLDAERWWVKLGWWAVDSCNTNSWTSAKDKVLAIFHADIMCTQ